MNKQLLVSLSLCALVVCAWALPASQDPNLVPFAVVGSDDRQEITGRGVGPEKSVVVLEMLFDKEERLIKITTTIDDNTQDII